MTALWEPAGHPLYVNDRVVFLGAMPVNGRHNPLPRRAIFAGDLVRIAPKPGNTQENVERAWVYQFHLPSLACPGPTAALQVDVIPWGTQAVQTLPVSRVVEKVVSDPGKAYWSIVSHIEWKEPRSMTPGVRTPGLPAKKRTRKISPDDDDDTEQEGEEEVDVRLVMSRIRHGRREHTDFPELERMRDLVRRQVVSSNTHPQAVETRRAWCEWIDRCHTRDEKWRTSPIEPTDAQCDFCGQTRSLTRVFEAPRLGQIRTGSDCAERLLALYQWYACYHGNEAQETLELCKERFIQSLILS